VTRDEFLSLPAPVALRLLLGVLDPETIATLLAQARPKLPFAPRFDRAIFRKEGIMWASEVDMDGLAYWHRKYTEGAAKGGQYAEADKKNAAALERWIEWRQCYPDAIWSGERDRAAVTAKPPSNKPCVYARPGQRPRPPPQPDEEVDPENF